MSWIKIALHNGHLDTALSLTTKALRNAPPSNALLEIAASVALRAQDLAQSEVILRELVRRKPSDIVNRLNLAQTLLALNKFAEAIDTLAPTPPSAPRDRIEGYARLRLHDFIGARACYIRTVAAEPRDAESFANLAAACLAIQDFSAAVVSLESAITIQPRNIAFYNALTIVLEHADLPSARLKVARDAVAVLPDSSEAQYIRAVAEAAAENFNLAETAFRRALAINPEYTDAYLNLGILLESLNRLDDLRELADSAAPQMISESQFFKAWLAYRSNDFELAQALSENLPQTIPPPRLAHLRAAIADRLNRPAEALEWFATMNRHALTLSPRPPTTSTYRDDVEATIAAMRRTPYTLAQDLAFEERVSTPVFLVGFPRSGTTLLDVMLGRLAATLVLEERPFLAKIEREIGSVADIAKSSRAQIELWRQRYFDLLDETNSDAANMRVIDKNPLHMVRAPVIAHLFPNAPILLVERHPCDVVLSCFMSNFRLNQAMRSFTDLTEAALTYDTVFRCWTLAQDLLPLNVHKVRYERLIDDPEYELREALHFLGAAYDPKMLDNVQGAATRGRISTASYAQVSEPLYRRAMGRWTRYRNHLEPVMPILEPWIKRMGYNI